MKLIVNTRAGTQITLAIAGGTPMMEPLRDAALVEATCGGQAACATCHVHISPDWFDRVGPATGQEEDMLESSLERIATSRLSCQVALDDTLDGLEITIPPAEN